MLVCVCVCVCVSMRACVCTRGFLQESLSLCRQPRRSQTSQCQWLCKQCRCWSWCIGSWGILVTAIGAIRQPDVTCMPPNTVQHLCPPPLNTYTLHAQTQYTMETIHPGWFLEAEPVDIYTANPTTHSKHTNTVTKSLHLWLGRHVTQQFVCSKAHTASASYCLCWSGPPTGPSVVPPPPPLPIPLHYTKQSQIKHRLT